MEKQEMKHASCCLISEAVFAAQQTGILQLKAKGADKAGLFLAILVGRNGHHKDIKIVYTKSHVNGEIALFNMTCWDPDVVLGTRGQKVLHLTRGRQYARPESESR